ncbi:MAG: N-acetylmuramoyl-L-alanine amidase [Hespellia sp.]|nr:N-acetylmuramoyl-L-alanine amidase [Hespellia sp.]
MSICGGVAGYRGGSPKGIFIHNDAGSQNANAAFYRTWLPSHPLENGFAHYYVADDGILQAEDDAYGAWHCADYDGNMNYLSIEVCQSMGNLNIFRENEERALQLAANKCKEYGINPNESTIRLHREVYATSCPHRSVEIHGGTNGCKTYFINRIRELMGMDLIPLMIDSGTGNVNHGGMALVDFIYSVRAGGVIYPEVKNLADYAGVRGVAITDIAIRCNKGSLKYRVHNLGGNWLSYVTGCDWNDYQNGYAGNSKIIDAVEVYYDTPKEIVNRYGYQKAQYRVSPLNGDYYAWQYDNETDHGQDGYAGIFGAAIDRFQLF